MKGTCFTDRVDHIHLCQTVHTVPGSKFSLPQVGWWASLTHTSLGELGEPDGGEGTPGAEHLLWASEDTEAQSWEGTWQGWGRREISSRTRDKAVPVQVEWDPTPTW